MATKVSVLGSKTNKTENKNIEFVKVLEDDGGYEVNENVDDYSSPGSWDNITLLARDYNDGSLDLMFAYDNAGGPNNGMLFLGHFNDGTVE